jgi:hypothetical protein
MNTDADFDRIAQTWLQDGATEMPDRSLQAALDEVHMTSQRRFGAARRTFAVNGNAFRLTAAAVVGVLIIVAAGIYLANNGSGGVGGPPAATPSPTPTLTPSPSPSPTASPTPVDTTGWVRFSSKRYGYDLTYPPTWRAEPATRNWSLKVDRGKTVNPGTDHFIGGPDGNQIGVTVFSALVPAGTSNDDWIAAWIASGSDYSCTPTVQWEDITVGGQPAKFDPDACNANQAYVFIGDRAYVFSIWRGNQAPLLKAFLSTVRFHSDVLPSAPASPSP